MNKCKIIVAVIVCAIAAVVNARPGPGGHHGGGYHRGPGPAMHHAPVHHGGYVHTGHHWNGGWNHGYPYTPPPPPAPRVYNYGYVGQTIVPTCRSDYYYMYGRPAIQTLTTVPAVYPSVSPAPIVVTPPTQVVTPGVGVTVVQRW